jgi:hypothetical protein
MAMSLASESCIAIGTPVCRQRAYVLDLFLDNQKQIQQARPAASLLLATCEEDFAVELEGRIKSMALQGEVIRYEVAKPDYATSEIWNIACGREAIRRHVLKNSLYSHLLFLDADMVFDPLVIGKLEGLLKGYDVIFSGYPLRNYGMGLAGAGCLMLTRHILEKIHFRCYEFKNGQVIFEDNLIEMDVFEAGGKIRKGYFISIDHYASERDVRHIGPQKVDAVRMVTSSAFVRYCLIKASVLLKWNIAWSLKVALNRTAEPGK